jgi:hypothetical protein
VVPSIAELCVMLLPLTWSIFDFLLLTQVVLVNLLYINQKALQLEYNLYCVASSLPDTGRTIFSSKVEVSILIHCYPYITPTLGQFGCCSKKIVAA